MVIKAPKHNLFFFHIPKTAGTSVSRFFTSAYGVDNTFRGDVSFEHVNTECHDNSSRRIYHSAHLNWDKMSEKNYASKNMVFFRDPKRRIISTYYFIRNSLLKENSPPLGKISNPYKKATAENDLKGWLKICANAEYGSAGNGVDNLYYKCLLGGSNLTYGSNKELVNGGDMQLAKVRLDQFDAIGIVEDFYLSMKKACNVIGIDPPLEDKVPFVNVSTKPKEILIDPDCEEYLHVLTSLDSQIYDYSLERFKSK